MSSGLLVIGIKRNGVDGATGKKTLVDILSPLRLFLEEMIKIVCDNHIGKK